MKKGKIILFISGVIVLICIIGTIPTFSSAKPDSSFFYSKWGNILKNESLESPTTKAFSNNKIYEKGLHTTVSLTDVTRTQQYYILSGMNSDEAFEKAVSYVEETEALYYNAIASGYDVTDDEVSTYIEDLKSLYEEADNKDDIDALISQFDSEEEYWNYEYEIYHKLLPIQNYVKATEKEYLQTKTDKDVEWNIYFTTWKQELVEKEKFQLVE